MKITKIVLASGSPRRRELLAGLGLPFEVKVIDNVSEAYPADLPMEQVPQFIAREKASAYRVTDGEVVITADTVVELENDVLGKPRDAADAHRMLRELSGRTHRVITGVCLTTTDGQTAFSAVTEVTFKALSDEEIGYYIARYKPFDKAGAYGIQEWIGYIGVTSIRGSFYNVMGFPVQRVYEALRQLGVDFSIAHPQG